MEKDVRLALVNLCHRFDWSPQAIVDRAKILEDYVLKEVSQTPDKKVDGSAKAGNPVAKKKAGNPDILS